MLDDVNVEVKGLRELEKMLLQLAPKEGRKAMRGALVQSSLPLRKRAKALAPLLNPDPKVTRGANREPGWLRDAIRFEAKYDRGYSIVARVGEHSRFPKEKLAATGRKGITWGHLVEHGGKGRQREQAFMGPAWGQTQNQVLAQFSIKFQKILFKKLRA